MMCSITPTGRENQRRPFFTTSWNFYLEQPPALIALCSDYVPPQRDLESRLTGSYSTAPAETVQVWSRLQILSRAQRDALAAKQNQVEIHLHHLLLSVQDEDHGREHMPSVRLSFVLLKVRTAILCPGSA